MSKSDFQARKFVVRNGFVTVTAGLTTAPIDALGTVVSNLAYYGYAPSKELWQVLSTLSSGELATFWKDFGPSFEVVTGDDRNMDKFVVYKNFPKEVLKMSEAQYWISQILMYIGLPNELFTEDEEVRPDLKEKRSLKALQLAIPGYEEKIFDTLVNSPVKWSDNQTADANYLLGILNKSEINVDDFEFNENGINIAVKVFGTSDINVSTATNVLRLAAGLSGGDISLKEKVKFKKFTRPQRKMMLGMLDNCRNIVDDFYMRPEIWKRLLSALHPGDYKCFKNVIDAYNLLYTNSHKTYNSRVEAGLKEFDPTVLDILQTRPGDFMRRLHKAYAIFGNDAFNAFEKVLPKLTNNQLLKIDRYIATINSRNFVMHPPKGNWAKVKVEINTKAKIDIGDISTFSKKISETILNRLEKSYPDGFDVASDVDNVKLQTNDQKLASYGRGTVFPIPPNVEFIRSASYWASKSHGSNWFDNGWNFFNDQWRDVGTCCWNHSHDLPLNAAVFSGDPTNSKELKGRACQMIDLNLAELEKRGVRYAVWSVLCFSNLKFSEADDVLATLQWGEDSQSGKLYEPSRAQMVFPLKSENLHSYVAYIDIKERKLVYMDMDFGGSIQSAGNNADRLSEKMPAYVEHLATIPSVYDLFSIKQGIIPVLYSDANQSVEGPEAYVFKRENIDNSFESIDLERLLSESE